MATKRGQTPSRPGLLARACHTLRHLFAPDPGPPSRAPGRRLADLQQLEDRRLLSVVLNGGEFRVNTFTNGPQQTFFNSGLGPLPSVTAAHAVAVNPTTGDFVITWSSQNQDGNGWGVYAQRYNAAGVPQGAEFRVNTTTNGDQAFANVAVAPNGTFIITWSSNQAGNWNVYAQRYDAAGVPQGGEFQVSPSTGSDQKFSDVAVDSGGNFLITWAGHLTGNWGIYARTYNANGNAQGPAFAISPTTAGDQFFPSVAMDPGFNFVVTWSSQNQDGSGWGVYAQRFNPGGTRVGAPFLVNTTTAGDQVESSAAMDSAGNFVITWSSNNQDGSGWGVYAKLYNPLGVSLGGEFRVNTTTANDQAYSAVAMAPNGHFVVTWSSQNQDGSGWGVYAQNYKAVAGIQQALGGEYRVNTTTVNDQQFSSVAVEPNGQGVFAWSSQNQDGNNWGVYAQRTLASDILVTPTSGLVTTQAGGTASFTVALSQAPVGNVTIPIASSDTAQGGTVSTPSLTFTPLNWNQAQTVTVTGAKSGLGTDVNYFISVGPASGLDPNYQGETGPAVYVTNQPVMAAPGITVMPTSGLVTSEAGDSASFTVVLNTRPTGPVTVGLGSSNASAGTVSRPSLTFDPTSWNVPQLVVVTGVDDHIVNGNVPYQVTVGPASSSDPNYNGLTPQTVALVNQERDVASVVVTPTSGLVTTEAGGQATFTVALTSIPSAPVILAVSSSDTTAGTVSAPSLTFDASSWNVPQTVTVTGVDDQVVTADRAYTVTVGPASTSDANYAALAPQAVSLTDRETDVAGFAVTPASLTTTEAGGQATFGVALTSIPTAPVTLTLTSSNPGQGSLSRTSLTFDASNWNAPQKVTVTGLDDHIVNGDQTYQITGAASSSDANYNGLAMSPVAVTNREADAAGIAVTPTSGLQTTESGGTASFTVSLTSQPVSPVTVAVASSDSSAGTVSAPALTFSASNWSAPQTVTVTGVDDHIVTADRAYQVTVGPASSADANYNGRSGPTVSLTNKETDTAGVIPTPVPTPVPTPAPVPTPVPPPTPAPGIGVLGTPPAGIIGTVANSGPVPALGLPVPPAASGTGVALGSRGAPANGPAAATVSAPTSGSSGGTALVASASGFRTGGVLGGLRQDPGSGVASPVAQVQTPATPAADRQYGAMSAAPGPESPPPAARGREARPAGGVEEFGPLAEMPPRLAGPVLAVVKVPAPPSAGVANGFDPGLLWTALDETEDRLPADDASGEPTALVATGLIATAGYVLLNTRAGFWLLSLVTAKPLWKDFDPLEILYTWDPDAPGEPAADGDREETLVSLVS